VLVRLDSLETDADRDALRHSLDGVLAREGRLLAQRDGRALLDFTPDLLARLDEAGVAEIIDGQERIFNAHAEAIESQVDVWRSRAEQYSVQLTSMRTRSGLLDQQLVLADEELGNARRLLEKGFERRSRVLDLERQHLELQGAAEEAIGEIAALHERIREAETQVKALLDQRNREVSEELREVQGQRVEIEERLRKAGARAGRSEVLAPQDGVVMNLRYFAPGAVVPSGGAIMDVVPTGDQLVIEARIDPLDIDIVEPGLPATVRLVAFRQRTTPTLEGTVTRVSADAVVEERSGQVYFVATVEVPPDELARASHVRLYPGMPASVAIVTGERTLLDYLVQPIADSFASAFRDD
jgi:HlyD family type I secretion membrane fusion protein